MITNQIIALSKRNFNISPTNARGCSRRLLGASGALGVQYVAALGGASGKGFIGSGEDRELSSQAGWRIYQGGLSLAKVKTKGKNARALRRLARFQ